MKVPSMVANVGFRGTRHRGAVTFQISDCPGFDAFLEGKVCVVERIPSVGDLGFAGTATGTITGPTITGWSSCGQALDEEGDCCREPRQLHPGKRWSVVASPEHWGLWKTVQGVVYDSQVRMFVSLANQPAARFLTVDPARAAGTTSDGHP